MAQQGMDTINKLSGDGEEEFLDFEEDLIEEKFIGGESSGDFAKRVALRNQYVATCNKGKKEFAQTIGKAVKTLHTLGSQNVKIGKNVVSHIDDQLAANAASYKTDVYKIVDSDQSMLGSAEGKMKALHTAAWNAHQKNKKYSHDAKKAALIKKAMLLQTGQ